MQRIEINLRKPFEDNLERALALPENYERADITDQQIAAALRRIYELAYGRSVETTIGLVAIAPALIPALAETRLHVANREELLAAIRDKLASTSRDNDRPRRSHFSANSALMEFLRGRLGAPEFWEHRTRPRRNQARVNRLAFEGARI